MDTNGDSGSISHGGKAFAYCDAGDNGAFQVIGGYQLQTGDQITLTWWAKSSFSTPSQNVQLLAGTAPISTYAGLTQLTNYASTFTSGSHAGVYTQFSLSYTAKAGDTGKYPAVAFMATGTGNSFANFDDFSLAITSLPATTRPVIGGLSLAGGNLVISGSNGTAGLDYLVLLTTNLSLASSNWVVLGTNAFDTAGAFSFTNPVSPASPQRFYQLRLP